MTARLSTDTQAILLLTAPLIVDKEGSRADRLTPGDYTRLARRLRDLGRTPADLVAPAADKLLSDCDPVVPATRLRELLGRGFQLAQAVERWSARAIWVISRADEGYPKRLKRRLQEGAPPILYGCGDLMLLASGGLAVVGSRDVSAAVRVWTAEVGRLAAHAGVAVISGGASDDDETSVRGALEAGGRGCMVLSDSLDKQAISRSHRQSIIDRRLVLVSPHDPATHLRVDPVPGPDNLIHALADQSLVVDSALESGGTWAGAIELLRAARGTPLFVRQAEDAAPGNAALLRRGAIAWPAPASADALRTLVTQSPASALLPDPPSDKDAG